MPIIFRLTLAIATASFLMLSSSCRTGDLSTATAQDENLWLEDINAEKSLTWVKEQNTQTEVSLSKLPNYTSNEGQIKKILLAKDRLPFAMEMGNFLYNFWQDEKSVRGIWRRTSLKEYQKKSPRWEVVIDLDQLARKEKENWVYKGADCLAPDFERCLVRLSRAGKDAKVIREFDLQRKTWIKDGFELPEAKSDVTWINKDTVIVGTDFGPNSMTNAGYPRILKIWKRGQPLIEAKIIYEGKVTDVSASASTFITPKGNNTIITRSLNFYSDESFELSADLTLKKINKPDDASISAWLNGQYLITLRSDWNIRGEIFQSGSLIALPPVTDAQPKAVFAPNDKQSIAIVRLVKDALLINYLDSIQGRIARAFLENDSWTVEDLPLPNQGDLSILSSDAYSDSALFYFEDFLTPGSIYYAKSGIDLKPQQIKPLLLKQLPARFDSSNFMIEQLWATSKDGTKVPYFFIHKKNLHLDGSNAVLINGYGGFEVSQTPTYLTLAGKVWLERGGSYVMANIRGGGEFGPKWHQAALKENRQKAFDDFIAIAENLIARKISNPSKLAITGGSNGGLLVGATFVQRPELYKAVICSVPLLDMLRYNKLLAGASWEGEYGDPNDSKIRSAILKYSPYQNLKPEKKYPEVFFMTSTADDRVHPGHARKMAARMKAQGKPFLYFENIEGGHGAAANILQRVKFSTLQYTFLQDRLL